MRLFKILMLLMMFTVSCALFKQKTETMKEQHQQKASEFMMGIKKETSTKNKKQEFLFSKDSSQNDYAIQLWPKGTINILPGGEITGQFDSVLISGKQQKIVKLSKMLNSLDEDTGKITMGFLNKKTTAIDQMNTEKKTSYNAKWILFGGVLVIFIAFLFFWRYLL